MFRFTEELYQIWCSSREIKTTAYVHVHYDKLGFWRCVNPAKVNMKSLNEWMKSNQS